MILVSSVAKNFRKRKMFLGFSNVKVTSNLSGGSRIWTLRSRLQKGRRIPNNSQALRLL